MPAGYWFVQPFKELVSTGDEIRCDSCDDVIGKVKQFRRTQSDPKASLRVHVPSHATREERARIDALGVKSI